MKTGDRVHLASPGKANEEIERQILKNIRYFSHNKKEIPDRLRELEQEWDIERALQMNASILALAGTVLAATVSRKWLILPALVATFLTQHATQGWCPPLPLLRSMGFRTRQEIDSEKYALMALQGTLKGTNKATDIFEAVTS